MHTLRATNPIWASSELLYVTSASFFQVTSQGSEYAVVAAARSHCPALFRDMRTAASTRDAVTLMLRLTSSERPLPRALYRGSRQEYQASSRRLITMKLPGMRPRQDRRAVCPLLACSVGGAGNNRVGQFFFLHHRSHIGASEWWYAGGHGDRSTQTRGHRAWARVRRSENSLFLRTTRVQAIHDAGRLHSSK